MNRTLFMNGYRVGLPLLVVVGLLGLSGAGCPRMMAQWTTPAPRVLPASPSLEQVIQAVNRNSAQIQSYWTSSATLTGPGWPTLHADIAFQRPRLLRLRAATGLTGAELDLGSNQEIFWIWLRRNQPPAVYFCRHEQFAASRARQMIPVDPDWLLEVLGPPEIDPALPHQGPFPAPGGRLQIRTIRETPDGPTTKITLVDAASAWVMEQHVYDAHGKLRASAVTEGYRRDPLSGLFVPAAIRLDCPAAQFSMRIDLGNVQVNQVPGNQGELWAMPNYPGAPPVDLADPNLRLAPPAAPPAVSSRPLPYDRRMSGPWR
jgi:hypothetical protein